MMLQLLEYNLSYNEVCISKKNVILKHTNIIATAFNEARLNHSATKSEYE